MRYLISSLGVLAVLAGSSWAQEALVGASEESPGESVSLPATPEAASSAESLEQRVERLEAELEKAKAVASQASPAAAAAEVEAPPAAPAAVVDNSWRYKRHNGAWWYWLPSNRWVYWSNGAWVDHVPGTPVIVDAPSYGITRTNGSRYPYTGGYRSYYPSSAGVYVGGYGLGHHHGYSGHGHVSHGHVSHGHANVSHGHVSHGHVGHGGGHGGGHGHSGGHGHH